MGTTSPYAHGGAYQNHKCIYTLSHSASRDVLIYIQVIFTHTKKLMPKVIHHRVISVTGSYKQPVCPTLGVWLNK